MSFEGEHGSRRAADRLNVVAPYITLSSIVYYAGAILVLHLLRTDFDPAYRYLSEYAIGQYGALMTSMFFVLSAGVAGAVDRRMSICFVEAALFPGPAFLAGVGVCCFTRRSVPRRSPRYAAHSNWPNPRASGYDRVSKRLPCHGAHLGALRWEDKWQSMWRVAVLLSIVAVAGLLVFDRFAQANLGGLAQRILLTATLIWMWILGRKLLILANQANLPAAVLRRPHR
jgi:hypothetical protein